MFHVFAKVLLYLRTNYRLQNTQEQVQDGNVHFEDLVVYSGREMEQVLGTCYVSFLLHCAYLTDYHWDRHLYFVITSPMHRLYSLLLTCSTPVMTRSYYRYY
jgi:hypothetical protein